MVADAGRRHGEADGKSFGTGQKVGLRPVTNFPLSNPRSPPASVVRTDWVPRIPALGWALRPLRCLQRRWGAWQMPLSVPSDSTCGSRCGQSCERKLMMVQAAGQVALGAAVFGDVENRAHDSTEACRGAPRWRSAGSSSTISSHSASVRSVVQVFRGMSAPRRLVEGEKSPVHAPPTSQIAYAKPNP